MLNRNERMAKMNAMGVDTGKFFTVNLPNGLAKNSTITLAINENGEYTVVNANTKENDVILNQIIEDGYVRNSKLHRRFVMAQMFQMLSFESWDGKRKGYNDYLRYRYGFDYTFKMMLEEVRVLGKLETRDVETFVEREHFFNRPTVARVIKDYLVELKKYVDNLPTKKCKGVPYKKVKGTNIFVADLDKKVYLPVERCANKIMCAKDYNNVYYILRDFMNNMVKLPYDTKKSAAWIDAFKGAGAYYTLKNLVMFHNCGIKVSEYDIKFGMDAVDYIFDKLYVYNGEYYRMFALMKKVIADNGLDTKTYIREICNK